MICKCLLTTLNSSIHQLKNSNFFFLLFHFLILDMGFRKRFQAQGLFFGNFFLMHIKVVKSREIWCN